VNDIQPFPIKSQTPEDHGAECTRLPAALWRSLEPGQATVSCFRPNRPIIGDGTTQFDFIGADINTKSDGFKAEQSFAT
jgi:hypothetical protein